MGCDIHAFVEVKDWGRWRSVAKVYLLRNYTVFALMADVRNSDAIIPIAAPKGLPPDVAWRAKSESYDYGVDAHSHSWLGGEELHTLESRLVEMKDLAWDIKALLAYIDALCQYTTARLVFFFDN